VIASHSRFGRSAMNSSHRRSQSLRTFVIYCLLLVMFAGNSWAVGRSGMFLTKVKFEYQYSDYNEYSYPLIELNDSIKYEYIDPYILNFPENRILTKITQSFGPISSFEARYEYSGLTSDKDQNRYYFRFERNISALTGLYGVYQYINIGYDSPDSTESGGNMFSVGVKHDRSGWIKGEMSFSYDHNRNADDLLTQSYMPMAQLRWSIDSFTALTGRWDGYWAVSDSGTYPAHAITLFLSRYLPTQTAVHILTRFYNSEAGVHSISPAIEIAQYVRWNLTARLNYRYYENSFDEESAPDFVEGGSIKSHSVRTNIEWQVSSDLKLHLKLRRYVSNQDIKMNTYLLGFEYEL